jgi:hypothetical protein
MKMISREYVQIVEYLKKNDIDFVLTGALAASIWGVIRATSNIDFSVVISRDERNKILKYAQRGYEVPINTARKIVLRNPASLVDIDFQVCDYDHCRSMRKRAERKRLLHRIVRVALPEDLIISKLMRLVHEDIEQDRIDILWLATENPLDGGYMERWISRYGLRAQLRKTLQRNPRYKNLDFTRGILRLSDILG